MSFFPLQLIKLIEPKISVKTNAKNLFTSNIFFYHDNLIRGTQNFAAQISTENYSNLSIFN